MRLGFIAVILAFLGLVIWTAWHFWLILPFSKCGKWAFTALYLLSFLVLIPHYAWGDRMPFWLAVCTYELGNSCIIFFLYAVLIFIVLGLGRLFQLLPASFLKDSAGGSATVLGILALLMVYGGLHYKHKYRESFEIQTGKPLEKPLTLVLASDLHAGYHNRKPELSRWADMINAEQPDLVLFAGDIIDGSLRPVREGRYEEVFRRIQAPVYACLGNHEYFSGETDAEAFLAAAGIHLLRDSSAVAQGVRIIGRDDRSNPDRAPLSVLAPRDTLFTILLDHQPYHLEEAQGAGIDFQFSGHTHHGQIWPLSWLTDIMYEKAFGHHRRGDTQYYISSGLGIWGGKFRIGTRSEYVVLKIIPR